MFKLKKPNFRGKEDNNGNSLERRSKSLGRDTKPRKVKHHCLFKEKSSVSYTRDKKGILNFEK